MKIKTLLFFLTIHSLVIHANNNRNDSLKQNKSTFQITANLDLYGNYIKDNTIKNLTPFYYNHSLANTFNINLAYVKLAYIKNKYALNIAIMDGVYTRKNLNAEPKIINKILEANLVYSLKHNWEIQAGIFASHLGFESAIAKDNYTITRSFCSEQSPYYESGIRFYKKSKDEKFLINILLLNGWQNIAASKKILPALGWQFQYVPNKNCLFNSSAFVGKSANNLSDNNNRYFHNFYFTYLLNNTLTFLGNYDFGFEQSLNTKKFKKWQTLCVLANHKITKKINHTARIELFNDRDIIFYNNNILYSSAVSYNIKYNLLSNLQLGIEYKNLSLEELSFTRNNNNILTGTLSAWF